jgi:hypothetical protein
LPEFYSRFKAPIALARKLSFTHPMVVLVRETVAPILPEDLGHGMFHSSRVSIDSATLICVELESSPVSRRRLERLMVLGLISGLLHDIRRGEENHAQTGALEAARFLEGFPLGEEEIECICQAIHNHEAFILPVKCSRPWIQLISDCLYDADKFRWGRDTFTHTLWHMMHHQGLTLEELIEKFPWGIKGIVRVLDTFRTSTGRQFGPQTLEAGMEIGREIYRYLIQYLRESGNAQ